MLDVFVFGVVAIRWRIRESERGSLRYGALGWGCQVLIIKRMEVWSGGAWEINISYWWLRTPLLTESQGYCEDFQRHHFHPTVPSRSRQWDSKAALTPFLCEAQCNILIRMYWEVSREDGHSRHDYPIRKVSTALARHWKCGTHRRKCLLSVIICPHSFASFTSIFSQPPARISP